MFEKINRKLENKNLKFDLWVLIALVYLIPCGGYASNSNMTVGMSIAYIVCTLIFITLFAVWLKRCGMLKYYRYLILKQACANKSKKLHRLVVMCSLPCMAIIIYMTTLSSFFSVMLCATFAVVLSVSFEDVD